MQISLIKFNQKASLTIITLILNNYLILSLNLPALIIKLNLVLFFSSVIYFYTVNLKNNFILKFYFVLILLICLGTPAEGWDLRSLYLFHAKRIFFDDTIYSVADNYAIFSHNDYPLLLPSFSSSFAKLVGYWHEIFPKTAFAFIYLPPLIFFSSILSEKKYALFFIILFFFIGNHLFNGGVDGVVAVYFITCVYCFYQVFFEEKKIDLPFIILTLFFSITLSLLKNEGTALLFIIFTSTIILSVVENNLEKKQKLFFLLVSFIPIFIWKIFCYKNGINNTDFNPSLMSENFLDRLTSFENYKLFFNYLIFSNEKTILAIILFIFSFVHNFNKKLIYFIILLFVSYLFLLLVVYFSTPYDLNYHLETSAYRVLKSLSFLLGFFALYNSNLKYLK